MKTQGKKGWICLDIDGTITADPKTIPTEVVSYLSDLHHQNWEIVFVTGRTFSFAQMILKDFKVPYFLVPQNGASSFEMPRKAMLTKNYLSVEVFYEIEKLLKGTHHDFVFFGGYDQGESKFYRPHLLLDETRQYFEQTLSSLDIDNSWRPFKTMKDLPFDEVPYGKIYGREEPLSQILISLKQVPSINVHLVQDSVNTTFRILQIMRNDVDKGRAVLDIMTRLAITSPIISAGNDNNDEPLLQIADVKIAMGGSPKSLTDQATLIAPPVEEMGIIPALELAISQVRK